MSKLFYKNSNLWLIYSWLYKTKFYGIDCSWRQALKMIVTWTYFGVQFETEMRHFDLLLQPDPSASIWVRQPPMRDQDLYKQIEICIYISNCSPK